MLPTCRSQLVGHIADPDHVLVLPEAVLASVVHVLVLVVLVHPAHHAMSNQGIWVGNLHFPYYDEEAEKKRRQKLTTVAMPELDIVIPWLELIPFIVHVKEKFWNQVLKKFILKQVKETAALCWHYTMMTWLNFFAVTPLN